MKIVYAVSGFDALEHCPHPSADASPYSDFFLFRGTEVGSHDVPAESHAGLIRQLHFLQHINGGQIFLDLLDINLEYFDKGIRCDAEEVVGSTV